MQTAGGLSEYGDPRTDPGRGDGPTGTYGTIGPQVGPLNDPPVDRGKCVAASAAAVVATAEDLATFAGVGLVLKGARGAQAGVKLATAGRFAAAERLGATHAGTAVTSRHIMNSSGAMIGGIGWGAATSARAGQDYGLLQIVGGLIPGVNM